MSKIRTILLFTIISIPLLICCSPDYSWACLDCDLFYFLQAADRLGVGHPSGYPLLTLFQWLIIQLPGNTPWLLSLLTGVIPTIITCYLIYKIVEIKQEGKIAPIISAVVFVGINTVFSQAIITEIYSLMLLFIILPYYLLLINKPKLANIALIFGMGFHYFNIIYAGLYFLLYKEVRRYWYILPFGALSYLYLIFASKPPYVTDFIWGNWQAIKNYFTFHSMYLFSLPVWELPERIVLFATILIGSFSVAVIPLVVGFFKSNWKFKVLLSTTYIFFLTTMSNLVIVHILPALAFSCIAVGIGLPYLLKYLQSIPIKLKPIFISLVSVTSAILILLNIYYYDIGNTLDPAPTAARQLLTEFDNISENDLVVIIDEAAYSALFYYNSHTGRDLKGIRPFYIVTRNVHPWRLQELEKLGYITATYEEVEGIDNSYDRETKENFLTTYTEYNKAQARLFMRKNSIEKLYIIYGVDNNSNRREVKVEELWLDY